MPRLSHIDICSYTIRQKIGSVSNSMNSTPPYIFWSRQSKSVSKSNDNVQYGTFLFNIESGKCHMLYNLGHFL